jgi:hypothetical protein
MLYCDDRTPLKYTTNKLHLSRPHKLTLAERWEGLLGCYADGNIPQMEEMPGGSAVVGRRSTRCMFHCIYLKTMSLSVLASASHYKEHTVLYRY